MEISDLSFPDEEIPAVDLDKLPEQAGSIKLPQPGDYIFTLPADCKTIYYSIATPEGLRLQAKFEKKNYLIVKGMGINTPLWYNFDNRDLLVNGVRTNNLAQLLKALGFEGVLTNNPQYAAALELMAGHSFLAELNWVATNQKTSKRFAAPRGYKPKSGSEIFTVPRGPDGLFQANFDDEGTNVRCFPRLRAFRSV